MSFCQFPSPPITDDFRISEAEITEKDNEFNLISKTSGPADAPYTMFYIYGFLTPKSSVHQMSDMVNALGVRFVTVPSLPSTPGTVFDGTHSYQEWYEEQKKQYLHFMETDDMVRQKKTTVILAGHSYGGLIAFNLYNELKNDTTAAASVPAKLLLLAPLLALGPRAPESIQVFTNPVVRTLSSNALTSQLWKFKTYAPGIISSRMAVWTLATAVFETRDLAEKTIRKDRNIVCIMGDEDGAVSIPFWFHNTVIYVKGKHELWVSKDSTVTEEFKHTLTSVLNLFIKTNNSLRQSRIH